MANILFLNGCGSSGKTTLSKAIQHISEEPWLRLGVDTFIEMMPPRFVALGDKSSDGYFTFTLGQNSRGPTVCVEKGKKGDQVFSAMPEIADLLAKKGNDLIIDEVLLDGATFEAYVKGLSSHRVYFIGVFCDLAVMQERESQRGDRLIGLSNDQIDRVHRGFLNSYDFSVDTTNISPVEAARLILEFMKDHPEPLSFLQLKNMK